MTAKVIVTVKMNENLASDLAANNERPKAWAKTITSISLGANGGAALLGEFVGPKKRMESLGKNREGNHYRYKWELDLTNQPGLVFVVALGVEYRRVKYYAPIVLINKGIYNEALKANASIDAKCDRPKQPNTQLNYNPKIKTAGGTIASVTLAVLGSEFCVAYSFDKIGNQNLLYSAAYFIENYLFSVPEVRRAVPSHIIKTKVEKTRTGGIGTLPYVVDESNFEPPPPAVAMHKDYGGQPHEKEKVERFQVHPHITKKMLGTPYENKIDLPEGVWFMSDADGLAILMKDGKPRMMHILADYPDKINDDMAKFLREQAKILAQISAAYILVAGMNDKKDDKDELPKPPEA